MPSDDDTPPDNEPLEGSAADEDSSEELQAASASAVDDEEELIAAFERRGLWERVLQTLKDIWNDPRKRYGALGMALLVVCLAMAIPSVRYFSLNTIGIRTAAAIRVLDAETKTPLKNVEVRIGNQSAKTASDGRVQLSGVKHGRQAVVVEKAAYATWQSEATLGLGSNQLSDAELDPVGTRLTFSIVNWLTMAPLEGAEVTYGESGAFANESGVAVLTIPPLNDSEIEVVANYNGYHSQTISTSLTTQSDAVRVDMVLDDSHFFVSRRAGRYDIYKSNVDGGDQQLLIEGTGKERSDIRFSVSQSGRKAVLVAGREGKKNKDNFQLVGAYVVDLERGALQKFDESERVDLVGWIDNHILYIKVSSGLSGSSPERHKLMSYNVESGTSTQIATANHFNDVVVTNRFVFYAPSNPYADSQPAQLYRADPVGGREVVYDGEVWTILQTNYDEVSFYDTQREWFMTDVHDLFANAIDTPPTQFSSRIYTNNQDDSTAIWVDQRDGKGVLLAHDTATGEDRVLWRQGGLRNPVRWLDEGHIVYRVVNDNEIADYVLSVDGGEPAKVVDVSDVSGYDRYYYY